MPAYNKILHNSGKTCGGNYSSAPAFALEKKVQTETKSKKKLGKIKKNDAFRKKVVPLQK